MIANSASVTKGELDISIQSPSTSPGVLGKPISAGGIRVISSQEDSVVKIGLASIINTMAVELEQDTRSIDSNRDWLVLNGGGKLFAVSFINLNVRGQWLILGGSRLLVALSLVSLVWIAGSIFDGVIEDISIGPLDNSSVASVVSVSVGAINELLFGVLGEGVIFNKSQTGETLSSRESPA